MIVLPVGHEQTTVRRLPWVNFGIMALCVAGFVFSGRASVETTAFSEKALALWGLVPARPAPFTLLTHMFLHVGWYHLIGNLLILYLTGLFIEDVWGRPLYASFYLGSGLAAAMFHVAGNVGDTMPMVGASGAIAGVMGAFLVRYGATRIRFFFLILFAVRGTFSVPAWVLLPLWFLLQLASAVVATGDGVAYWAHVGGFSFGVTIALVLRGLAAERRWIEPELRDKINRVVLNNSLVDDGMAVREGGNVGQAIVRLRHALECDPSNPDAARALWSVALENGSAEKVAALLVRSIVAQLRAGESRPAIDLWGEILARVPGVRVETAVLLSIGALLENAGRNGEARLTLQKALRQLGPGTTPAFGLRLARIARLLDPQLALSALDLTLADPQLDPESRRDAARLRQELKPVEVEVT